MSKPLFSILVGAVAFHLLLCGGRLGAATNYEGTLEYWINTSSNVVPMSLGARLRARPGSEPFFAPTMAWNGQSIAFPGLFPAERLSANGLFFSEATYTNDPDAGEFFSMVVSPIAAEGLSDGARNVTPEPMPIYAELASPFSAPCPSLLSPGLAGAGVKFVLGADPECLECPDDDCAEALREEIERIIGILRSQNLLDEAFLLEQMLEKGHFKVDSAGDHTRTDQCEFVMGKGLADSTPTLLISPALLCKTNAADLIAFLAGVFAVQWENPVLRRTDEISGEAALLIFLVALGKDELGKEFAEFKKFLEAFQKPIRAVEGPFPIMTCLFDALCKASMYKGARSDEAEEQARELKRVLQKIKDLNKDFEKLTRAEQEAFVQNMIDKFKAIIVAIKARNWVQLEGLGIPRACIDPTLMRLADEIALSTANPPGKADAGKADQDQKPDVIVPIEVENTVRIYPGEEDFHLGLPVPVAVPGGPHIALSLGDTMTSPDEPYVAGIGTRRNGVAVIRRNESAFTVVPLLGPTEILALHAVDADADGRGDLVAVAGPLDAPTIVTHLRRPRAAFPFEMEPSVPCPAMSLRIAAGDWNDDGRIDLALARPGFIAVFHQVTNAMPGAARWIPGPTLPGVAMPVDLQVIDIDGDHRLDLVAADFQNSRVQVWLNDSPGGLRPGNFFSFAEPVTAVAVGDLDGNGVPDLLAGLGETPRLALQMNPPWDSPPAVAGPSPPTEILFIDLMASASQLLLRDLDGDNDRDLLVATAGGFQIFQRLFNQPIVECSLRIPMIRVTTNNLIVDRAAIDPTVLAGPFKLLYRDDWQSEWRLVPASDIVSTTPEQWILRRPGNSFRLFRIIADTPP